MAKPFIIFAFYCSKFESTCQTIHEFAKLNGYILLLSRRIICVTCNSRIVCKQTCFIKVCISAKSFMAVRKLYKLGLTTNSCYSKERTASIWQCMSFSLKFDLQKGHNEFKGHNCFLINYVMK